VTILGVVFMAHEGLTLASARKLAGENTSQAGGEAAGVASVTEGAAPGAAGLEKGAP
jgi:hypothetical protein